MVKTRCRLPIGPARGARWGGLLLVAVLGGVARAAEPAASAPLDLSLPREAGQWTGVASRVRQDTLREEGPAASGARQARNGPNPRERGQPYGTGYEARMTAQRSGGGMTGSVGAGPGRAGGAPAAPRGGGRGH
jgi:hypothetical protein